MAEFMEASALIQGKVDDDAKVVIGALYDESLGDELHVTVIATGVGDVATKNKTIAQVGDLPKQQKDEIEGGGQGFTPARVNPKPRVTSLPGSNFDSFESIGSTGGIDSIRGGLERTNWNEDLLETPTYLRKKAN